MKVYTVWYESDLGTGLWGIYNSELKAKTIVKAIEIDYNYHAWYNIEEVL